MVLLYRFCSLLSKNSFALKLSWATNFALSTIVYEKIYTTFNILRVLRKVNLFNDVKEFFLIILSIGLGKSTVVVSNSFTFFLSISDSSLLVILSCSGQFLQSPNHSGPSHQI